MTAAACSPARLNVLLGAIQVIELFRNDGLMVAKGICRLSSNTKSQWISSETTSTLCLRQISPRRSSSLFVQTLPAGLCGLHRIKSFTFGSLALASKSSKSIRYTPSSYTRSFETTSHPLRVIDEKKQWYTGSCTNTLSPGTVNA